LLYFVIIYGDQKVAGRIYLGEGVLILTFRISFFGGVGALTILTGT